LTDDPNYEGGNLALDPDASETERAKYQISQMIIGYCNENDLLQKDLAEKLGIDTARMSEILRGRLARFTLDLLIGYAEILFPKLQIQISIR
jgi:predicted XRE-type DNA-binding protein